MRIGIDFHAAQRDGAGNCTYIRNLAEHLLMAHSGDDFYLYVTDSAHPYLQKFKNLDNVRMRSLPSDYPLVRLPALGIKARNDRLDLLHVQYVAPPFYKGKLFLTVHDISYIHYPEMFRRSELLYLRHQVKSALKRAEKVITISEYSRQDIVRHFGLAPTKVAVTYLAAGPQYHPVPEAEAKPRLFQRFGLAGPYILFVGRLDARKNISLLITAFDILKQTRKVPHRLVLAGKSGYEPIALLDVAARTHSAADIQFLGPVPDSDLPALYSLADVFVFPSLYEGFGLPCLEAMACGCPVVTSRAAALPEILGDAGRFVHPLNGEELAAAMDETLSNPSLAEKMKRRGLDRAGAFSWTETACRTLEIYKNPPPPPA